MDCPITPPDCNSATKRKSAPEDAPIRKGMIRIPQAKVEWILSRRPPPAPGSMERKYRELDGEEELMEIVRDMARSREQAWATMSRLQQWVRCEYAAKGFVEVAEDQVQLAAPPPPDDLPASYEEAEKEDDEGLLS